MAKVEFRPTLKRMKLANDKVEIVLEIPKDKILNSLGSLGKLEGGKITASFRPETISYRIPYDKSNGAPTIRYVEAGEGNWTPVKEEQTNLLGEDDIENREFLVELDTIDEFIRTVELDYPGDIDPAVILEGLEEGRSLSEIGMDYNLDDIEIEEALAEAREYYAPYAAAWDEKRKREVK